MNPKERQAYVKEMINQARAGNKPLQQLLSNQYLAYPKRGDWLNDKFKQYGVTVHLLRDVENYCKTAYGASTRDVVHSRVS